MRRIYILRGCPASGKSTWINKNHLEPYTISTDTLRLMYQSPVTQLDGNFCISQNNDKDVWEMVMSLLERRMEKGELVVVDATHYKSTLVNKYNDLIRKHRYRAFVVDFSDVSLEELKERNSHRGFRTVPDEVIDKMYTAIHDYSEIKNCFTILKPEEAEQDINKSLEPFDANIYNKVVVIGDVHGCYTALKEYFDNNPFSEDTNYIFCGDYTDRGLENREALEFLIELSKHRNCVFLEGNHEKWLRLYSAKDYNIDDYRAKTNYKDPYVTKVLAQLRHKLETISKQLKDNKRKEEDIINLMKSNGKVFYQFEELDGVKTIKDLRAKDKELEDYVALIHKYIWVLEHEEHNTKEYINHIQERYLDIFNEEISLDITNILEKNYSVKANRRDNPIKSMEFINNTLPQIQWMDKVEIRKFCDRLAQMSYFTFAGRRFLVTHAGVPTMPTNHTPTIELIKGVGKYEEHEEVDKRFADNWDVIQIHGHRNIMKVPVINYAAEMYCNLEGQVEFGGHLRIVEITKGGIKPIEIKNNVFKAEEIEEVQPKTDLDILKEMYLSKWIQVKELGDNIVSFNFTRDAFEHGKWDTLTCAARGLFVDKTNGDIVARSFEKFFNYKEQQVTEPAYMKEHIQWPLYGYKKENGYLGIVSKHKGKIRFFSKSTNEGDFANWFVGVLCDWYDITAQPNPRVGNLMHYSDIYNRMLQCGIDADTTPYRAALNELRSRLEDKLDTLIEEGYSYVFEVIDIVNDPHIIKYRANKVTLLEVFKNQLKEEHVDWQTLHDMGDALCVPVKVRELVFHNWEEFEQWKYDFHNGSTKWNCKHEGYVFEDAAGYRVKFKSTFYLFWKQMRGIKERLQSGKSNLKTYKSKEEIEVVQILNEHKDQLKSMSIIDIEDIYYKGNNDGQI